jgi:TRAP-type C4-dicarboxylate transport system permease small subunit
MKVIDLLSRYLNYIAGIIITAVMLLTVADVGGRYLFSNPVTGTKELTEVAMVTVTFLAVGLVTLMQEHIKVDLLVGHLSIKGQAIFDSVTHILGIAVCIILIWQNSLQAIEVFQRQLYTALLRIPLYPFYWVIVVGLVLMSIIMIMQLIKNIYKVVK